MRTLSSLERPATHAEHALVAAILHGDFPPGSSLPAERELAVQVGVTRPTLREALQRLARDGWLTIQQGKPTVVNDYWREGGLGVLAALAYPANGWPIPSDFIPNLLQVRLHLAPAYTRAAVERDASRVAGLLDSLPDLAETPEAFAAFDWRLHHALTVASGNPIYTLILNGFARFYEQMACRYFSRSEARATSQAYYRNLRSAALRSDAEDAEALTREVMQRSIDLWGKAGDW
jgi:GntR family transcriptional regulator, negative regulator for fad regulon and positive regulator of fabA